MKFKSIHSNLIFNTVILFFALVYSINSKAATYSIPGFTIKLNTQSEVDAFASNLVGIDSIHGALQFVVKAGEVDPIVNISLLNDIVYISGDLILKWCQLHDIKLDKLRYVDNLFIHNLFSDGHTAADPMTFTGEISLNQLDSTSYIGINRTLNTSINLPNLKKIKSFFHLSNVDKLTTVDLSMLSEIGGNFYAKGIDSLKTVEIGNLETIGGEFLLEDSKSLKTLNLSKLQSVGGDMRLASHPVMEILEIPDINSISGKLTILSVKNIQEIKFDQLERASYVKIYFNEKLTSISMNKLLSVDDNLEIYQNTSLQSVSFNQLNKTGKDFVIAGGYCHSVDVGTPLERIILSNGKDPVTKISSLSVPSLDTVNSRFILSGFHPNSIIDWASLKFVGDNLEIKDAPDTNYCHLPAIVQGDILLYTIIDNLPVTRADLNNGFCNFKEMYMGHLFLKSQTDVNNVNDTLQGREKFWGRLYLGSPSLPMYQSDPIINLNPLKQIKVLTQRLEVGGVYNSGSGTKPHYNPSLTSLDGLENLTRLDDGINISNNASLSDYCALSGLASSGTVPEAKWSIFSNKYNPTFDQIKTSACLTTDIYIGDIYIRSQSEMNALQSSLSGIKMIKGSLYIGSPEVNPSDPVINLLSLKNIEVVNGNVFLGGDYNSGTGITSHHNPTLLSLQGLGKLKQITGMLEVSNNPGGLSFNGVDNLQLINNKLFIQNNQSLVSLNGLETISSCDTIVIKNNPQLSIFCALNYLVSLKTYDLNTWNVSGNNFNPTFAQMKLGICSSGSNVSHIYFGDIVIRNQTEMDNVNSILNGKTIVAGNINIGSQKGVSSNPITELKHLKRIRKISGSLTIGSNPDDEPGKTYSNVKLTSLEGFDSLGIVGVGLNISRNPLIHTINGFDSLATINSHANIQNNAFLYDFCGLVPAVSNMQTTPFVWQTNNNLYDPTIVDMTSGNCAKDVSHIHFGDIIVRTQTELDAIAPGLVTKTRVIGNVYIGSPDINEPDSIYDLSAFQNLETIDSSLYLGGTYDIGSGITAHYNKGINSLIDFSNLTHIGNQLSVCNTQISSLNGLSLLSTVTKGFIIEDNVFLNDYCDISALVIAKPPVLWQIFGNEYNPTLGNMTTGICNKKMALSYIGDIYITSQTEMDALTSILSGKKYIYGNVYVGSIDVNNADPVVDFSPLQHIIDIEYDFRIGGLYPPEGEAIAKEHYNMHLQNLSGLDTLTLISGNLTVSNNNAANFSLSGLQDLELIGGNLDINNNEHLSSIEGLNSLEKIDRNFMVFNNPELINININSTTTIGKHIQVLYNANLESVNLNQLSELGNNLIILGTDCIYSYSDGLQEYTNIEVNPTIAPQIDTLSIPVLDTINGKLYISNTHDSSYINWNNLVHINDTVFIGIPPDTSYCHLPFVAAGEIILYKGIEHDSIHRKDLEGDFCNFPDIYFGDLILKSQDDVNQLDSILKGKDRIWGSIYIGSPESYQADPIINLSPLSNIKFISKDLFIGGEYNSGTGIQVHNNPSVTNLDGLENIIHVKNDITIENNAFLINYCALSGLVISGEVPEPRWHISNNRYNPSYIDISTLACVSTDLYIGDLYIKNQSEMDGLLLTLTGKTMIDGNIFIGSPETNPTDPVISLSPLDSIEVVNGDLFLGGTYNSGTGVISHHNPSLSSLQGLSSLTQITGTFGILNNPGGLSFNGAGSLQIINDKLLIENNQSLVSLNGLEPLSTCDTIVIQNNNKLDQFCALNHLVSSTSYNNETWLVSGNSFNPDYNDMLLGKCSSGADLSHIYFGDVVIRNQAEMDTVNKLLNGITIIDGNISIGSEKGDITNPILEFKHLSKIKYVTGSLTIGGISGNETSSTHNNPKLISVSGLDSLTTIGLNLNICRNPMVQSIDGFEKLKQINGQASIKTNQFLYDYCNLTEVIKNMENTQFSWQTENNFYNPTKDDMLAGKCALDVSHIYFGDIIIQTQTEADAIQTLLNSKTRIIGNVYLGALPTNQFDSITDLSAFQNIVSIDSSLFIGGKYNIGLGEQEYFNTGLDSLKAFSSLTYVGNLLSICNNRIEALDGLSMLSSAEKGVYIINNTFLNDFCDLTSLINSDLPAFWQVSGNDYNPTINDMLNGNCNKQLYITYVGDIYIRDQTEMDALTSLLINKKIISGSVFVGSPETSPNNPIVDFSPLKEIYEIENDLWIGGSYPQEGSSDNHYHHNPLLANLSGLDTLCRVNGSVNIMNNSFNHFSLNGLNALNTIGKNLNISNNKHLKSLSGLDNLESIGYRIYIFNNPSLLTLYGIDALTSVENLVSIDNNAPLFNFCALNNLIANGYSNDWYVANNLYNPSVSEMEKGNCSGLIPEKYFLGSLWITNQTEMDVAGVMLKDSIGIAGDVYVGSTSLPAIDPIMDFSPINNIKKITGGLYIGVAYTYFLNQGIYGNPLLSSLNGLSKLESVGHLYIEGNPQLNNLSGLNKLQGVSGDCYINNNNTMESLIGLSNLDSIGSVFYVYNNPVLKSLSGIDNLKWIGNSIDIYNNNSLESLQGLESLNTVNRNMYVRDNPLLNKFCALTELAKQNPLDDQRWFAENNGNDPIWSEIEDGTFCKAQMQTPKINSLAHGQSSDSDGGLVYLSDEDLFISLANKDDGIFNLNIYTSQGSLVYSKHNIIVMDGYLSIDAGYLSSGIYIVQFNENNNERHITSKLLKAN